MRFGKILLLSCVTMGMTTGCVSIGNKGMGELPVEEQEEVRQELNEAAQEIQAALEEVENEMQAELDEASTELYAAWDEVSAEMYADLDEIRAEMEDADWVRGMICEDERPRKVLWRKGDMEAEIVDRVEFADSLALEDWKASDESTEGLTESVTVLVQWKKSIGLLDGWKKEYIDIGSITAYEDSSLVAVEICAMDDVFGRMQGLLRENGTGKAFTIVYEVPDKALESLRGSAEK